MKDLKVIKDSRLVPIEPGGSGSPAIIIVRNNDVNGRRLGVFTKTGNAVIGQRVNHADALHEVKSVSALPDGYNSGVEVNLSSKRNYHYFATYMLGNGFGQTLEGMGWFAYGAVRQDGALKLSENTINLEKLRTTLKSGECTAASDTSFSMRNSFASFSLVFAGITYHIGLDVAKHPAHITADLNFRLNRIHPQLRGYVTKNEVVYEDRIPLMFYIAAPEGLDVTIPLTTFPVDTHLSPSVDETEHDDGTFHLNNKLTSALLIDNVYGVRETTNTVSTVSPTAVIKTTEQLIDEAFVVDLNAFTHEVETPTLYKGRVTIPANAFKTWNRDQRLNLAILKLKRDYDAGRVFRLLSVRYKTSAGTDIDFTNQFADILVMPAPAEGDTVSSIYLDEMESVEVDRLQGYAYPTAEEMKFPESGGLNEESAMYIGVLATPTPETRNSIFFRHTVAATYLEIEYELVEADVIPTVKIDDLGTLDYHYINTEEHAFLPIAFSTAPVHNWDIEFITDGQAERYQGLNNGPLLGEDNIHITTQGTVGEAVILAGIDYSKVLAPTVEEPLYHYLGVIGADVWLNQNLPHVNVKTFREVNPVRSNYKVIFPAVAMTGTLVPLEEPLIAKQTDGTIEITGRFHNPTYPKNVFLHSTLTSWSWNLKGADVQPADVVNFDAATGIFSTRFAIDDLVEYGPGLHTFRVTAQAKYPWLAQPTQYSVSMDIQVLPAVEGIEDDVTFISASQYDTEVSSESTGGYRLVDLDTGEVLATGSNAHSLKVDATARGLVQIDLIMGEVFVPEAEIVPISCEGAPNSVSIDIEGQWDLEIEGVIVGSGTMDELKPLALTHDVEITTEDNPNVLSIAGLRLGEDGGISGYSVNGGATVPWSTTAVEDLLNIHGIDVFEESIVYDPYDPYAVTSALYFRNVNTTPTTLGIQTYQPVGAANTHGKGNVWPATGVGSQWSDRFYQANYQGSDGFLVNLGEYNLERALHKAKASIHPDARLWVESNNQNGAGMTFAINDPKALFRLDILDKYHGTPLPDGTLFYYDDQFVPYVHGQYLSPVDIDWWQANTSYNPYSVYPSVGEQNIEVEWERHTEGNLEISRAVSSAITGNSVDILINGVNRTIAMTEETTKGSIVAMDPVTIGAGTHTLTLKLPVELKGYTLTGPWPFAHQQSSVVDENGDVSLTVVHPQGSYAEPEFVFSLAVESNTGNGTFHAMKFIYRNANVI